MSYKDNNNEEMKKGDVFGIIFTFVCMFLLGLAAKWFMSMTSGNSTVFFVVVLIITILFAGIFFLFFGAILYGGVERVFNTIFSSEKLKNSKLAKKQKILTICCTWIPSAIFLVLGYCMFDVNVDAVGSITLLFLDYLSTTPVILILAGIFFIPLYIRIYFSAINEHKLTPIIHTLIVVIGIVVTIPVYQANPGMQFFETKKSAKDQDEFGNTKYTVIGIAEYEVEKRLKAPSTAKFCSDSETEIVRDGNTWRISGWVDSQNSYGAMLRSEYVVKLTCTDKQIYILEYCLIE